MRSTPDRIRHAISFEIIAITMVILLGNSLFGMPPVSMGTLGIASSIVATLWTYLFNLGFDHALLRLRGSPRKGWPTRVLHTILFEITLTVALLPLIITVLRIGLLEALMIDVSLMAFFLIYTFVFNLAYDALFPVPGSSEPR